MLLRFQKAAVRGNYETGNQALSKRLRFLTTRAFWPRLLTHARRNVYGPPRRGSKLTLCETAVELCLGRTFARAFPLVCRQLLCELLSELLAGVPNKSNGGAEVRLRNRDLVALFVSVAREFLRVVRCNPAAVVCNRVAKV